MKILIIICILTAVMTIDPPEYNFAFSINFDETVVKNKTQYKVNGKMFYDPQNNM